MDFMTRNLHNMTSAILDGRKGWMNNTTIQKAIIVDKGVIVKESVLTFQNRKPD